MNEDDIINEFQKIVGKNNVSDKEIHKLAHSSDGSQIPGKPLIVVWPKNKEQIQSIVRFAQKNKINVTPRGSGTGLCGGAVPLEGIVLDLSGMNRIISLNKEKTITVEPGVVINDLNKHLNEHGLYFPVMPASYTVCTVGGIISTNASGERAVRYGKTKDWVEGLEIIDGTGNIHDIEDKNTINDFCGSEGVAGIIIEATLRVTEQLREVSVTLERFESLSELIERSQKLSDEKDVIALEYMDRISSGLLLKDDAYHLFVEYSSNRGEKKEKKDIYETIEKRQGFGPVLGSQGFIITEDPWIPEKRTEEFLKWIEKHSIPCFGHIGVGIFHPRFPLEKKELIREMFGLVNEMGGSVSGEHGIGIVKKEFMDKGFIEKIRALKKKYDPNNILNKGKLI